MAGWLDVWIEFTRRNHERQSTQLQPERPRADRKFEGLRLTAYQDMVGVWTIGYGHTGPDVKAGLTITQQQAEQLLINDLACFNNGVNALVTVKINQKPI